MERINLSRLILGSTLALVGVGLVLDRTGASESLHRNLWPTLLVGLGAARLLEPRTRGPRKGLLLLSVGVWLFVVEYNVVALAQSWSILLIILGVGVVADALTSRIGLASTPPPGDKLLDSAPLVVLGITVAFLLTASSSRYHISLLSESSGGPRVVAVMGNAVHVERAPVFHGGQMAAVMGKSELDLRGATIAPGEEVSVEVVAVMGQAVIRAPEGWTIDTRAVPVMGAIKDDRLWRGSGTSGRTAEAPPAATTAPRLVLRGFVIMGGLVIES